MTGTGRNPMVLTSIRRVVGLPSSCGRRSRLVHRRQFDADLEEGMQLHLELRQQEHLESGMTADSARAGAGLAT
jgi:hypothetical protein